MRYCFVRGEVWWFGVYTGFLTKSSVNGFRAAGGEGSMRFLKGVLWNGMVWEIGSFFWFCLYLLKGYF